MSFISTFSGIRLNDQQGIKIKDRSLYPEASSSCDSDHNYTTLLKKLIDDGFYQQDADSCFYVYRMTSPGKISLGIMAAVDIHVLNTHVLQHEKTLAEKTLSYLESFQVTGLQVNPVLLTHHHSYSFDDLLQTIIQVKAEANLQIEDTYHQLWVIRDGKLIEAITTQLNKIDRFYVADGHHRLAAIKSHFKQQNIEHNTFFLATFMSEKYITIKSYNRIVHGLNEATATEFINKLAQKFIISTADKPTQQPDKGNFILFIKNQWLSLRTKDQDHSRATVECSLDPLVANQYIFLEGLGIHDQANSVQLSFIAEDHSMDYIHDQLENLDSKAIVYLPRLSTVDFLQAVNEKLIFPPNSTYFEPKLLNGLVIHSI